MAAQITQDMRGQYADATINRTLGALSKALRLAWERGDTPEDYSARIKRLPERNMRDIAPTIEQVRAIADAASPAVRAAIWIAKAVASAGTVDTALNLIGLGEYVRPFEDAVDTVLTTVVSVIVTVTPTG